MYVKSCKASITHKRLLSKAAEFKWVKGHMQNKVSCITMSDWTTLYDKFFLDCVCAVIDNDYWSLWWTCIKLQCLMLHRAKNNKVCNWIWFHLHYGMLWIWLFIKLGPIFMEYFDPRLFSCWSLENRNTILSTLLILSPTGPQCGGVGLGETMWAVWCQITVYIWLL